LTNFESQKSFRTTKWINYLRFLLIRDILQKMLRIKVMRILLKFIKLRTLRKFKILLTKSCEIWRQWSDSNKERFNFNLKTRYFTYVPHLKSSKHLKILAHAVLNSLKPNKTNLKSYLDIVNSADSTAVSSVFPVNVHFMTIREIWSPLAEFA